MTATRARPIVGPKERPMPYAVYFGYSIAQMREDHPTARAALAAMQDLETRGAKCVYATDDDNRDWTVAELAALVAAENPEA
jgi:hypothetical protein